MRQLLRVFVLSTTLVFFQGCATPGADSSLLLDTPADKELLQYFKLDYNDSRADFRRIASSLQIEYAGSQSGAFPFPSQKFKGLTIDWCYVPPQGAKKSLLLVTSGLHGAEGPVGAAVQRHFMEQMLKRVDRSTTGYLFVHAMNPYGFHAFRRVTENNVDLNRNFSIDNNKLYETKNAGYAQLNDFLNPTEAADVWDTGYLFFTTRAISMILFNGMATLRQAILQGQYEYPAGIYFGGQRSEPQKALLTDFFRQHFVGYKAILAVDMHTGYGSRGVLHLFPNDPRSDQIRKATTTLFAGYKIDWGTDEDFYTITGQFTDYLVTLAGKDTIFVPMVFEYGTLDSDTTGGAIESIKRTIQENQGHHHGYADPDSEQEIKQNYYEMFYPSSPHWRTHILKNTIDMWATVLPRLEKLGRDGL